MIITSEKIKSATQLWDVCIVGTGPAGLSLALNLVEKKQKILLIESGDLKANQNSNALNKGFGVLECENKTYPMDSWFTRSRSRGFGGSSQIWDGHISQFNKMLFIKKNEMSWPISYEDLLPYYKKAKKIMGTEVDLTTHLKNNIETQGYIQKAKRFGDDYIDTVKAHPSIHLLLNTTVTELKTKANKIEKVIGISENNKIEIAAKKFVFATGAIENSRLLLLNETVLKPLMKNAFQWVGKTFAEHIQLISGNILLNKKEQQSLKKVTHSSGFSKHFNVLRTEGLLLHTPNTQNEQTSPKPTKLTESIIELSQLEKDNKPNMNPTLMILEQLPNKESSITLAHEKDSHGQALPKLNWKISSEQLHLWNESVEKFAKKLLKNDFGRSQLTYRAKGIVPSALKTWGSLGAHHPAGTTRMSFSDKYGVVDKNCKVFGLKNLYMTGSSVFSRTGATNPTLTIIALAIRLAQHLSEQQDG